MEKINVQSYLLTLKNKKFYYWPNPGNAGDALIAHATYVLFDSLNLNYEIVFDTSHLINETIVFAGGGNLVEGKYDHMYKEILKCVSRNKCIVLPHTIFGFKDLISHTKRNLTLLCREHVSYQMCLLNNANRSNIHLADDMAFQLPKDYFDEFKQTGVGRATCLREDGESAKLVTIPQSNIDISKSWNGALWHNKQLAKYATFSLASYLSEYEEIETDRLHVAILSALLGKKVIFYPNDYYKNRAVFENSLSDHNFQVSFINTSTDLLHSAYVDDLLKKHKFIK